MAWTTSLGLDLLMSAQMDNEERGEGNAIAAEVRDVVEYLYWDLHDRWSGDYGLGTSLMKIAMWILYWDYLVVLSLPCTAISQDLL